MLKNHLTAGALSVLARRVLAVTAAPLLVCASASAATYTWDPSATGIGSDGPGTWDTSTPIWALSGADAAWPAASTDTAVFGAGSTPGIVTVGAGGVSTGGITFNEGYTVTGGSIALAPSTTIIANAASTINSTLTGSGALTTGGTNKLTLTAANTYTGGTTISDGVLELLPGATLGSGPVVNKASLSINVGTGTETFANTFSGDGGINKVGSGTMLLTGNSTYNGTTFVSAGKLQLDGTVNASAPTNGQSNIALAIGATLTGTGSYIGSSTSALSYSAGSIISPGDTAGSIGTLSFSALTMVSTPTACLFFDLSSTDDTSDMIALSGVFTRGSGSAMSLAGGSYVFDFNNSNYTFGATYTLLTFASTNNLNTGNLIATDLPANAVATFTITGTSLKVTVVPEPSQYGLAFGAFALLVILMRRKRGSVTEIFKGLMKNQTVKTAVQALLAIATIGFGAQSADAKMVTINLGTATFDDLQAAMNHGGLTSVELATLYTNRRAVYDQAGIKLNSVVALSPSLMADAQAADTARAGGARGPLLGLFFCTKDSYPTINMVQSGGVKSWLSSVTGTFGTETGISYGPNIPNYDAYLVGELKSAGAIQLGHGNMDTWATSASSTTSNAYGTTLNAYTLGSASGSSGGPGCLTGSDFASFAWGGETGGSIRNPSDRAGITGFKVGVGTESINDIIPLSADHDVVGPMARYVQDEAYIMDATAVVQDPNDPWYGHSYFGLPLPSGYHAALATATLAGKTIGVIGTYNDERIPSPSPTPVQLPDIGMNTFVPVDPDASPKISTTNTTGTQSTDPAIKSIFNRACDQLRSLGANVVTVFLPPNMDTSIALPAYDNGTAAPLRSAMTGSPTANQILAWMNAGYLNANGQGIYTRLTQANAASSSLSTTVRGLAYAGTFSTYADTSVQPFFAAQQIYQDILNTWMDANHIDAFVWPISYTKSRTSNSVVGRDLINNLGNPICTVPMGIIPQTGEPTVMGFYGKYRHEKDLLALAYAYESNYNYRVPSTLSPPLDGEVITYDDTASLSAEKGGDTAPPIVSIKKKATIDGSSVLITGIADDASGIGSLTVYVNGHKVATKAGKKWVAKMSLADAKKLAKTGKTLDVTVMAKDAAGNASATVKAVKI